MRLDIHIQNTRLDRFQGECRVAEAKRQHSANQQVFESDGL